MHHRKEVIRTNAFGMAWEQRPPSAAFAVPARALAEEARASIERMEGAREAALKTIRERSDRGEISAAEEQRLAERVDESASNAQLSAELQLAVYLDEAQRLDEDRHGER